MAANDVVYLDHNATTPVAGEVLAAMLPYLTEAFGNPSSPHGLGRRAAEAVVVAREQVAALIGAKPAEVVFTSGGTESNNLALRGVAEAAPNNRRRIVTSAVEHPATELPLAYLAAHGWNVSTVGVTTDGYLDMSAFRGRTRRRCRTQDSHARPERDRRADASRRGLGGRRPGIRSTRPHRRSPGGRQGPGRCRCAGG